MAKPSNYTTHQIYAKLTHGNKNADCYKIIDKDDQTSSLIYSVIDAIAGRGNSDKVPDAQLMNYKCTNKNGRAFMLNSEIFFWLYKDLLVIEKSDETLEKHSFFFLFDILLNRSIFPFESLHYQLPKDQSLLESPAGYPFSSIAIGEFQNMTWQYAVRAYHLYIFILLVLVYFLVNRFLPLLPYRENDRKITEVIDRMTATHSEDNTLKVGKISVPIPFSQTRVYQPLASRDIEQHFLDVIASLTHNNTMLSRFLSVPTPDITIIFDELDKLGSTAKEQEQIAKNSPLSEFSHSFEFARSNKIKELLSDLKNVIDSKHCRFILIGGRHLWDEWLADQTKRDQLLPSIFDKAIYLPSLLTDTPSYSGEVKSDLFLDRIKEYICQQHVRAIREYKDAELNETIWWHFADKQRQNLAFAPQDIINARVKQLFSTDDEKRRTKLFKLDSVCEPLVAERSHALMKAFAKYLAFRSHGIPKRLNESFGAFIKPLNRVIGDYSHDNEPLVSIIDKCKDVLLFNNVDIYRIQLNRRLYDRIDKFLGRKLYGRDDKMVTAVFFITDYLFKFHSRAFDWDSLEKIDDIADINRAPDLREMIHELVEAFAEMILHPVLNGMYAFRFKSSTAREIAYLSKLSPTDSAAFNFTLDESQALKELYSRRLEVASGATPEVSAALGELYEYDQEYTAARREYNKTIQMIDASISSYLVYKADGQKDRIFHGYISILDQLENTDHKGVAMALSNIIDWAIFRLRLMLKIGMTFELTRNYERAQAHYHEAHMLSRRFLSLVLSEKPGGKIARPLDLSEVTYFNTKHFNILYQAVFAKAWLAEKIGAGVDTSMTIIKTELFYYECLFHHFRLSEDLDEYLDRVKKGRFSHASFGLIKSEFYNKAGDLCFFKGANLPDGEGEASTGTSELSKHGYLYKASYYYAASVHYLRRFNLYRHESSKTKYSAQDSAEPTFSPEQLPNYPLMETASSLADVAEVLLARVDVKALIEGLVDGTKKNGNFVLIADKDKAKIYNVFHTFMVTAGVYFDKWMKYRDPGKPKKTLSNILGYSNRTESTWETYVDVAEKEIRDKYKKESSVFTLWRKVEGNSKPIDQSSFIDFWLGTAKPNHPEEIGEDVIESSGTSGCAIERVICYMAIINTSISYWRKAGKHEEAAYELRRATDSIISLLELMLIAKDPDGVRIIETEQFDQMKDSVNLTTFIRFLINHAIYFIERSSALHAQLSLDKGDHQQIEKITSVISSKLVLSSLKLCVLANKMALAWGRADFVFALRCCFGNGIEPKTEDDHYYSLKQILLSAADSNKGAGVMTEQNICTLRRMFEFPVLKGNAFERLKDPIQWLGLIKTLLEQRCISKRYPILNRLGMLQQLSALTIGTLNTSELPTYSIVRQCFEAKLICVIKEYRQSLPEDSKHFRLTSEAHTLTAIINLLLLEFFNCGISLVMVESYQDKLIKQLRDTLEKTDKALDQQTFLCTLLGDLMLRMDDIVATAISYVRELLEIEELYNSPHHFTPAQVAYSCYNLGNALEKYHSFLKIELRTSRWENARQTDLGEQLNTLMQKRLHDAKYYYLRANEYFGKSKQMYTLRSEYYKSIGDLYYLYDDYNDRYIHHGKAIQILSLTVSVKVERHIRRKLREMDKLTKLY